MEFTTLVIWDKLICIKLRKGGEGYDNKERPKKSTFY